MIYAGGISVPVSSGPVPELHFGADDQSIFVESLETEMQRLGIVGSIAETAKDDTLNIVLNFVQTEHYPNFQEYKLTVSLTAKYQDEEVSRRYEILSSEGDSGWQKWNTSASKGKEKAASQLMDRVMADIQEFVARMQKHETGLLLES